MPETIAVLTFNCFKLKSPARDRVVEAILALDPAPDVIGVQEVFNRRVPRVGRNARRRLREGLAASYRTVWVPASGIGTVLADGLLLAVARERWAFDPERDHFHVAFGRHHLFEDRGMQAAVIADRGPGGRRLVVANTHLSLGRNESAVARQLDQVRTAAEFLERLERERSPEATVVVGDFNTVPGSAVQVAVLDAGFVDSFGAVGRGDGFTRVRSNTQVKSAEGDERRGEDARIDYVFARPAGGGGLEATSSRVVLDAVDAASGHNLSDHFGVLTTFAG